MASSPPNGTVWEDVKWNEPETYACLVCGGRTGYKPATYSTPQWFWIFGEDELTRVGPFCSPSHRDQAASEMTDEQKLVFACGVNHGLERLKERIAAGNIELETDDAEQVRIKWKSMLALPHPNCTHGRWCTQCGRHQLIWPPETISRAVA